MILLATTSRDLTSDYVVLELRRRGVEHVRLNTEELPTARAWFRPDGDGWSLDIGGRDVQLARVGAAYYRRPGLPLAPANTYSDADRLYVTTEWSAVLQCLYTELEARWLNAPSAIFAAEDKPRQLAAALSLGLSVPATMVTNDPEAAVTFTHGGPTVAKPLRQALLEEGGTGRVIFTSRIGHGLVDVSAEAIRAAPMIFQREIPKIFDVRVTVVGESVFAASIHSQECAETVVDWRRGSRPDLRHEVHNLPTTLVAACVALTRHFNLRFGAIDLVLDQDGKYWFLEINPNGQWAWIENRTGLPITSAIVDELIRIAKCP